MPYSSQFKGESIDMDELIDALSNLSEEDIAETFDDEELDFMLGAFQEIEEGILGSTVRAGFTGARHISKQGGKAIRGATKNQKAAGVAAAAGGTAALVARNKAKQRKELQKRQQQQQSRTEDVEEEIQFDEEIFNALVEELTEEELDVFFDSLTEEELDELRATTATAALTPVTAAPYLAVKGVQKARAMKHGTTMKGIAAKDAEAKAERKAARAAAKPESARRAAKAAKAKKTAIKLRAKREKQRERSARKVKGEGVEFNDESFAGRIAGKLINKGMRASVRADKARTAARARRASSIISGGRRGAHAIADPKKVAQARRRAAVIRGAAKLDKHRGKIGLATGIGVGAKVAKDKKGKKKNEELEYVSDPVVNEVKAAIGGAVHRGIQRVATSPYTREIADKAVKHKKGLAVGGALTAAIGAKAASKTKKQRKKDKDRKRKKNNEEFEVTEDYKEFFRSALQKFGVDNPSKLAGDKKKSFFDYVDKNWKGKKETKEEKKIKLSGKKEKITFNPPVKEDVPAAMGMNPFQRVVDNYNGSSNQEEALNEVFQHTWGYGSPEEVEYREGWMTKFHEYVANEDPQQYVDILQVNAMYSAGARPEEAAKRVLGFRSESSNDFQNRQRRFDLAGVSGEDSDYEDANQWNGDAT